MKLSPHLEVGASDPSVFARRFAAGWQRERSLYTRQVLEARRAATDSTIGELTRRRVRAVADAFEYNAAAIGRLVQPVLQLAADAETTAGTTPLHSRGNLQYLFRDWLWGADETGTLVDAILRLLPQGVARSGHHLTLGAGAMRLPWRLAAELAASRVTAVELDPVLGCAFDHMQSGNTVSLYEIPVTPRTLSTAAVLRELAIPAGGVPMKVVLADIAEWAPAEPVDLLVTPFVLDVTHADALALVSRLRTWVRPGGWWVDVSPLAFQEPAAVRSYTIDEVLSTATALGFAIRATEPFETNHCASPLSGRFHRFRGTITVAQNVSQE